MKITDDPFPSVENAVPQIFKRAREFLGMTQKQFAQSMNVARLTVIRWENGTSFPEPDQAEKLGELVYQVILATLTEMRQELETRAKVVRPKRLSKGITEELQRWSRKMADALIMGGTACMTASRWEWVLAIAPRHLDDVPPAGQTKDGIPTFWGYDVGHRIEALHRGVGYWDYLDKNPEMRVDPLMCSVAEDRILAEVKLRMQTSAQFFAQVFLVPAEELEKLIRAWNTR